MERTGIDIALDRQSRFDLFAVAVTFTILGLAVQTAKLGVYYVADTFELIGWIAFVVSGLTGMQRLQLIPQSYRLHAIQDEKDAQHFNAAKHLHQFPHTPAIIPETNATVPLATVAQQWKATAAEAGRLAEKLDRRITRLYAWQRNGFLFGLTTLAVSRASPAIDHFLKLVDRSLL